MRLPIKTHAVKIRYREQLLKQMVHGSFGTHRGSRCVYITYDPNNDSITQKYPKRYSLESKRGKHYTPLIERFLLLKAEFEQLLADWRSTYVFEPPMVSFPIVNTYDPHHMNNRFFEEVCSKSNSMPVEHPVYSGDDILRSKNEQMGKGLFRALGVPFKYEAALDINNPDGYVPDYLLSFFEIDRCIYAEICGMTDKYEYSRSTAQKINFYSSNHYRPGREIIYSFMYDKYNFDEEYFASQILSAFETLIPDSALDWENCQAPCINNRN